MKDVICLKRPSYMTRPNQDFHCRPAYKKRIKGIAVVILFSLPLANVCPVQAGSAAHKQTTILIDRANDIIFSTRPVAVPPAVRRTELTFYTTELENFAPLMGRSPLPPLRTKGNLVLYEPPGRTKGVVVITPGSEGVRDGLIGQHVRNFLSISYAVAIVDSFNIRHVSQVFSNQAAVSMPSQVLDLLLALKELAGIKRFSKIPIGLFGTSRGGSVVNLLLDKRLLRAVGFTRSLSWACALYPDVIVRYNLDSADPLILPFLYIVAQKDDEVSPHQAIAFARDLGKKNRLLKLLIWPNAVHFLDAPFPKIWFATVPSAVHCPPILVKSDGNYHYKRKVMRSWSEVIAMFDGLPVKRGCSFGNTNGSNKKVLTTIKDFVRAVPAK